MRRWRTPAGTGPEPRMPRTGLSEAQADKMELICGKLGLRTGDRLLDVGCGWGSLAVHAAREGVADLVDIQLRHWRHIDGRATTRPPPSKWASTPEMRSTPGSPGCCTRRCAPKGGTSSNRCPAGRTRPVAAASSRPTSPPTCTSARWDGPRTCWSPPVWRSNLILAVRSRPGLETRGDTCTFPGRHHPCFAIGAFVGAPTKAP
ncbi:class I SAM-dependent methyltransferase [Streptomyces sp. AP-93]|uniref:SAM-dependent methyltransferase n=1 Tax=Streptomyces sp. AP-93 TaxID=2929048 RepID=UPI0027E4E869|nr:class I SAM-dependent methyltransferase [Streptomyces sp. AP-93]